ncbi:hypothetical protein SAY87_029629 [Trapa incisa]|uniref:Uncharacterized protein n=1 Tax=Trapa incisa TaxID=236973 RepID=A0AAN7K6T9_9MYRT|nr:hypothetical protein SAY87_029629 [Trapa incisa]
MNLTTSERSEEQGKRMTNCVHPGHLPLPQGLKWVADNGETDGNGSLLDNGLEDVDEEDEKELLFGAVVGRSNSTLSAYFLRPRAPDETDNLGDLRSARRAFSMGQIISTPEGYRRMDQSCIQANFEKESLINLRPSRRKRAGKFFETCRRFLGF